MLLLSQKSLPEINLKSNFFFFLEKKHIFRGIEETIMRSPIIPKHYVSFLQTYVS